MLLHCCWILLTLSCRFSIFFMFPSMDNEGKKLLDIYLIAFLFYLNIFFLLLSTQKRFVSTLTYSILPYSVLENNNNKDIMISHIVIIIIINIIIDCIGNILYMYRCKEKHQTQYNFISILLSQSNSSFS